jgi:hypothetical protein
MFERIEMSLTIFNAAYTIAPGLTAIRYSPKSKDNYLPKVPAE